MSIAKRNDGRFIVKYKDTEGRWKQRSFRSEAKAQQFDADCQYDEIENSRLTVLEAVLAYLKAVSHAEKTIGLYEYIVCGYDRKDGTHRVGPAEILANRFVDTLTRRDLEAVRENCRQDGLAPVTINNYVSKLKASFNWCADQDLIRENPWGKYRQLPGKYKKREGTLEDFRRIYTVLPPWMKWAATTAFALCLRPGISELFRLEWSAFNWRMKEVTIYMPKVDSTKIVFPPEGYMRLAWMKFQKDKEHGYTLVCRNRYNRPVVSSTYKTAWNTACRKVGVSSMPMYTLRHIAASEMLAKGADMAAIAQQLGHRDITTTASFYTHALASSQRRAAEMLPCVNLVQDGAVFDIEN